MEGPHFLPPDQSQERDSQELIWEQKSLDDWDNELFAQGVFVYPPKLRPSRNVRTPDFRSRRADLWKGLTTVLNHPEMDSVKSYLDAFRTKAVAAIDKQNKLNKKKGAKRSLRFV